MRALSNSLWLRLLLVALVTTGTAHAAIERHAAAGELVEAVGDGSGTVEAGVYPLAAMARGLAVMEAAALDLDRLGPTPTETAGGFAAGGGYLRLSAVVDGGTTAARHRVPLRHLVCVYRL